MTTVDSVTNPFFLGTKGEVTEDNKSNMLQQEDFLTLLTTQLQNQDPLSPMDNAEFLAQMAQFSAVDGIDRVNDSIGALSSSLGSNRVATAASMLGHSVLVEGSVARPDYDGGIHGMIDIPKQVSSLTVSFHNANTDETLYAMEMGPASEGWMNFDWDTVPQDMVANRDPVRIRVSAETENGTIMIPTSVFARVESALGGPSTDNITLQVEDYGALDTLEVSAFR